MPAGKKLIKTVKNSDGLDDAHDDLRGAIEDQIMSDVGRKDLCACTFGALNRNGGTIGVDVGDSALGHIDLNIGNYSFSYKSKKSSFGFNKVSFSVNRPASFNEQYIFTTTWNPSTWFTDFIPGIIAVNGTPYFITGSFSDKVKESFLVNCWGQ